MKETEADEFKGKYSGLQEALVNEKKHSAIERLAMDKGVKPEFLGYIKHEALEKAVIETTSTGNINVLGVDEVIDAMIKKNPELKIKGQAPNLNNSNPMNNFNDVALTGPQILALQTKDPVAYKNYMNKRAGIKS